MAVADSPRTHVNGLINRTMRLAQVALDRRLASHGVSFSQCVVLIHLYEAKPSPLNQGMLAQDLNLERSSMSTLVDSLERAGLVKRVADPNDGRRWMLALTARGKGLEKRIYQTLDTWDNDLLGDLSAADRRQFTRSLESVLARARALRYAPGEANGRIH